MKLFIVALDEYSIRIIQYIMPCSMHIEVTTLLEHIDEHLKIWMFAAWVLAAICLITLPCIIAALLPVTGYWITDHNVTFDQLHFIGPANSHTHALFMHYCIIGLSWLVCFFRAGFADHVKSRLRQWDAWGHYMEGMGLVFTPVLVRRLLRPSSLDWVYD